MKTFTNYIMTHIKESFTILVFGTIFVLGAQALLIDNVQEAVEVQLQSSKTIDSISDAVLFNTNQDYYDMKASVLKQAEKLESNPDDMKQADIEYLNTQCGLMDAWSSKGYEVTNEREVCDLFNAQKLSSIKE